MSAFELKIKSKPFRNDDVDMYMEGLKLTQARDQLPHELEGKVPLKVWQATHDKMFSNVRKGTESMGEIHEDVSKFGFLFIAPCLLPVFLPFLYLSRRKADRIGRNNERAFSRLVQSQSAVYRQYGVSVSATKRKVSHHDDSGFLGLHFEILEPTEASSVSEGDM